MISRVALIIFLSVTSAFCAENFRVNNRYDKEELVKQEFDAVYESISKVVPRVYSSTPAYTNLRNEEVVLVSSGTYNKMLIRIGSKLYKVVLQEN